MTWTDDLRRRLIHTTARTVSDEWARQMRATWTLDELCTEDQAECEDKAERIIDALLPVVREACAQAWDEGYADGGNDEHEFRPGRRATNPWREADS